MRLRKTVTHVTNANVDERQIHFRLPEKFHLFILLDHFVTSEKIPHIFLGSLENAFLGWEKEKNKKMFASALKNFVFLSRRVQNFAGAFPGQGWVNLFRKLAYCDWLFSGAALRLPQPRTS
jgi:hypothetical protein